MKKFGAFCILVISFSALSQNTLAGKANFPVEVGKRPESITRAFDKDYFVTVMNNKEPGDGEVVRLDRSGKVHPFAKGFDEPKGIAFVKDHLYISDLKRVWKINAKGEAEVLADVSDFPVEPSYLNDVAASPKKDGIYVTDMGANTKMRQPSGALWPLDSKEAKAIPHLGRVYFISLDGKVKEVIAPAPYLLNPNGVGIDNKGNLMVAEFFSGKIFVTNKAGELEPLKGEFRGADAIEQDKKGNYYVSSWDQGKVWKIDAKTQESTVLSEGHQSAADFYLETKHNRLLLPDMKAGLVHEVKLK